MTQFHIRV